MEAHSIHIQVVSMCRPVYFFHHLQCYRNADIISWAESVRLGSNETSLTSDMKNHSTHRCTYPPGQNGRERVHSFHLFPTPGTARNEDKGGNFSKRHKQNELCREFPQVSLGSNIWTLGRQRPCHKKTGTYCEDVYAGPAAADQTQRIPQPPGCSPLSPDEYRFLQRATGHSAHKSLAWPLH